VVQLHRAYCTSGLSREGSFGVQMGLVIDRVLSYVGSWLAMGLGW
jgi:hypothetical protein